MSFFKRFQSSGKSVETPVSTHDDHALVLAIKQPPKRKGFWQIRFLFRVLTESEKKRFLFALVIAITSLGAFGYFFGKDHLVAVPTTGGTYTEALVGTPKLINPVFQSPVHPVDADLSELIFSGLFRINDAFEPEPDLVESYQWLEDGKTLQLTLRKDARFHDGEPVDADDVIYTYNAIKNPAWRSPLAATMKEVNLIRVDDVTVQFQLPAAEPRFPYYLTVGILPSHLWEDIQDANAQLADLNLAPIGSGPYAVTSFTRDSKGAIQYYDLKRSETYYGVKPFIDQIRFRFYPDRKAALEAFKQGQVMAYAFSSWGDTEGLNKATAQTKQVIFPQVTTAIFNTKDTLLQSKGLREALTLAIPPQDLMGLTNAPSAPVNGPFPFLDIPSSTQRYDLDAARAALDKLGWKTSEETGIRTLQKAGSSSTAQELVLTIRVPEIPDLVTVAEALQRFWSLVGAKVNLEVSDHQQLAREIVTNRDHQIYLTYLRYGAEQSMHEFWASSETSGDGLNFSHIADANVDKALAALDTATSTEALTNARIHFAQTLGATYPAYFLMRPSYAYVYSNDVKGVNDIRINKPSNRFTNIREWYIDTAWSWK